MVATAAVAMVFAVTWMITGSFYDLGKGVSLEIAAVTAAAIGVPLSWWSFRGQLLDEPAEVAWVTWRRIPSLPVLTLPRTGDEERLESALRPPKSEKGKVKASPVVVLTGPSGVGKTQLAAGYARARIADGWPLVAWINAASHEEMLAGLLEFADALSLRVPDEGTPRAIERLRQHPPTGTQPSVIVFDGVVDVDAVRPYLPTMPGWRVIVTSSSPDAAALGSEVALTVPDTAPAAAQSGLTQEVCQQLGDLPAALELAQATTRELPTDPDSYSERLRSVPVAQLLGDGRDGSRHEENYRRGSAQAVLIALEASGFDADPATRRVLGLLAVLAPSGLTRGLLQHAALTGPEESGPVEDTVNRLVRWSLAATRMDGDGLQLHELTRAVVSDRLRAEDALVGVIADAADVLTQATFGEDQAWDRRGEGDLLVAHVAALSTGAGSVAGSLPVETSERVLGLRQWATRQLSAVGDGARAVELAESIRAECETLLGSEHPDSLAASDNLVIAYVAAGRAADGLPLARDVLSTRVQVLGAEHPDTLASRYTLGYAHEYAGELDEAVSTYQRAHGEYARVFGVDNPQTLTVAAALQRARYLAPAGGGRHRSSQRPTPQQR
ncbi:MAG TPA: tetratricopeptide repeat protein [Pseudonocardia sp.]|jgi:hypothetical protein